MFLPSNTVRRWPFAFFRPGRRAASTVEFSMVAPVFFLFVLGVVEVSRGLMMHHLLVNAARQGCRTGILPSSGNTQVNTAVSTALTPAGINSPTVSVRVNGVVQDSSTAKSGDEVTVSVLVPFNSVSWLPGTQFLFGNISAQYTLRKQ